MPVNLPSSHFKGAFTPPYSILAMANCRERLNISHAQLASYGSKAKGSGVNSKLAIYRLENGIYGIGSDPGKRTLITRNYAEALIKAVNALNTQSDKKRPEASDVERALRVCQIASSGRLEAINEMLYSMPLDAKPSSNPVSYFKNRWDGILAATEASAECCWLETYMIAGVLQSDGYLKDALDRGGKSKSDRALQNAYLEYHENLRKLVNGHTVNTTGTRHRVLLSVTAFAFPVCKNDNTRKEQAEILIAAARDGIAGLKLRIFDEECYQASGQMPLATVGLFDSLLAIHDLEDDIDATVDPVRVVKYWNRFDSLWQVASEKEAAVKIISKRLR
jgi:hypothetical protein